MPQNRPLYELPFFPPPIARVCTRSSIPTTYELPFVDPDHLGVRSERPRIAEPHNRYCRGLQPVVVHSESPQRAYFGLCYREEKSPSTRRARVPPDSLNFCDGRHEACFRMNIRSRYHSLAMKRLALLNLVLTPKAMERECEGNEGEQYTNGAHLSCVTSVSCVES